MGEKEDAEKISPPQSILIQASNPNAENDTRASATFPGVEGKYEKKYKIVVPVDEKPSNQLLLAASLMILISTGSFFLGMDIFYFDDEFACCLLCNGNAIGFALIGVSSANYGSWEKNANNVSGMGSDIIAALFFIMAAILFILWVLIGSLF